MPQLVYLAIGTPLRGLVVMTRGSLTQGDAALALGWHRAVPLGLGSAYASLTYAALSPQRGSPMPAQANGLGYGVRVGIVRAPIGATLF